MSFIQSDRVITSCSGVGTREGAPELPSTYNFSEERVDYVSKGQ